MKKDFYVFRHGQTNENALGVWQGCKTDSVLNEKGKAQAKALREKISSLGLNILFSSPLLRAVQTANELAKVKENPLPVVIMQNLRECCFGECEGLSFDAAKKMYGAKMVHDYLFPDVNTWDNSFYHGESKHDAFNRVYACLMDILCLVDWTGCDKIGIVAHAGVISALECGLNLKDVSYDNCSILHLCYDSATGQFCQLSD